MNRLLFTANDFINYIPGRDESVALSVSLVANHKIKNRILELPKVYSCVNDNNGWCDFKHATDTHEGVILNIGETTNCRNGVAK